jgi:site-specific recombinase XerD
MKQYTSSAHWPKDLTEPTGALSENLIKAFAIHLESCVASGLSPKTIALYDSRYKQFLTFLKQQGHEPPFDLGLLNVAMVRRASIWIREGSRGPRGGQYAARALVATLKTGSAWLADEGYLEDEVDPLARLKRPKASSAARVPFTQEDVRRLIAAAIDTQTGTRDAAIILLMLDTGMRVGGATSILRNDVDLKERRVVIRLKGGRQHALYFGSPDRRDGGRSVRALKRYIEERDLLVKRWTANHRGDKSQGHLFLSYDGWPLTPKGFHQALAHLAREAGLEGVFPHRLRHTFATHFLMRHPGDETGLRGILGHLSDDMYRVYSHIAHEIIAQRAGRVSLSEAWLGEEGESA